MLWVIFYVRGHRLRAGRVVLCEPKCSSVLSTGLTLCVWSECRGQRWTPVQLRWRVFKLPWRWQLLEWWIGSATWVWLVLWRAALHFCLYKTLIIVVNFYIYSIIVFYINWIVLINVIINEEIAFIAKTTPLARRRRKRSVVVVTVCITCIFCRRTQDSNLLYTWWYPNYYKRRMPLTMCPHEYV